MSLLPLSRNCSTITQDSSCHPHTAFEQIQTQTLPFVLLPQGSMGILTPKENSFFRSPSRFGIPKLWSGRAVTATFSSLRCHWFSVKKWKTRTGTANTFTRASSLWVIDTLMVGLRSFHMLCDCKLLHAFLWSLRAQTSELGVTEHVEGDPCKFALWVGRTPTSDNKIVLKVQCKQDIDLSCFYFKYCKNKHRNKCVWLTNPFPHLLKLTIYLHFMELGLGPSPPQTRI